MVTIGFDIYLAKRSIRYGPVDASSRIGGDVTKAAACRQFL